MVVLAYFFVAVLAIVSLADATDFCNLKTCKKGPHTMCRFSSAKPSKQCGQYENVSLTPNEKRELLDAHNKLRAHVARGLETRGRGQPAGRIGRLRWDNELEQIAQRWANQCDYDHDECRHVDRFYVGQNVAFTSFTDGYHTKLSEFVQSWYDEVDMFNARRLSRYHYDDRVAHYTQLVWGKTTTVGCGVIRYRKEEDGIFWYTTYIVCNYGPGGNVPDQPVYETY